MPTIRQLAESLEISAARTTGAAVNLRKQRGSLRLVKPGVSAIEHIVNTAQPGEVIHVADDDYFNPYLWRSYLGM